MLQLSLCKIMATLHHLSLRPVNTKKGQLNGSKVEVFSSFLGERVHEINIIQFLLNIFINLLSYYMCIMSCQRWRELESVHSKIHSLSGMDCPGKLESNMRSKYKERERKKNDDSTRFGQDGLEPTRFENVASWWVLYRRKNYILTLLYLSKLQVTNFSPTRIKRHADKLG